MRRNLSYLCLLLALGLFALNVAGIISPMGGTRGKAALDRRSGESDAQYLDRATQFVYVKVLHPSLEAQRRGAFSVPLRENYLIGILGDLGVHLFRQYEFVDADRAFRRGVGICSEKSIVLSKVLERAGIQNHILGLNGHVVVEVPSSGRTTLADADYGVVLDGPVQRLVANRELLYKTYLGAPLLRGRKDPYTPTNLVVSIYCATSDDVTFPNATAFAGKKAPLEQLLYALKWLVPIAFVLCALALTITGRNKES